MSKIVDRLQSEMKTLADMIDILGRENERLRTFCRPDDILGCSDEVAKLAYEAYTVAVRSSQMGHYFYKWANLEPWQKDAWQNAAAHVALHTLAVVDATAKRRTVYDTKGIYQEKNSGLKR